MTTIDAPRLLADAWRTSFREGPRAFARCWPAAALYVALGAQPPWSSLLALPFYLVLLVTIHRTVLQPDRPAPPGPAWFPKRTDWHYARAWLRVAWPLLGATAISVATVVATASIAAATIPTEDSVLRPFAVAALRGIAGLPLLWVFARASVLFPAAAIGERPRWLRDAFAITRGHTMALMVVLGVPAAFGLTIDALLEASFIEAAGIGVDLAGRLISLAVLVFGTVALSLVYRELRDTVAVPRRRRPSGTIPIRA